MNDLPVNMSNRMLGFLLILALSATPSFTQGVKGGVKGGYHQQQSESLVSFPAKEAGTCYKRVPYTHALAANISNGYVEAVPGTQTTQEGVKSGALNVITILDCCDGFVRNRHTGECETHCEEGCFGGVCSGPNICTCDVGHVAQGGICKPVCTRPCPFNSVCHGPEECKCNEGYTKENGECNPICPGGCINGNCIAPKVCRCKTGFSLNKKINECVPICEGGCLNGECAGPGFCRCYPGYHNPPGDPESCQPQCPKGCYGGKCLAPGFCKCDAGFALDSTNTCAPVCENGCGTGICVGPNQCSNQYSKKGSVVDQQSGNYGSVGGAYGNDYQATGIYTQQSGNYNQQTGSYDQQSGTYDQHSGTYNPQTGTYEQRPGRYGQQSGLYDQDIGQQSTLEVDNLQVSTCEKRCLNGQCSRNECICNRGYMLDQTDQTATRCLPICYGGCRNGVCSAPNTCSCNPGFEKDRFAKGRSICVLIPE